MTTYNWIVERLDAYPQKEGFNDVVFTVYWRIIGSDNGYSATISGAQPLELDATGPFTPYASLTPEQVIGWVKDAMGQGEIAAKQNYIDQQIINQMNPPVASPALPWGN